MLIEFYYLKKKRMTVDTKLYVLQNLKLIGIQSLIKQFWDLPC
jgi:hypothetical protein